jgi:hypothetical protein
MSKTIGLYLGMEGVVFFPVERGDDGGVNIFFMVP